MQGKSTVGLDDMAQTKHHNIFNQIPRYWSSNNIVGMAIGIFTKCLYNGNFDDVGIMIDWIKANNRTARSVCQVQKMTACYCKTDILP